MKVTRNYEDGIRTEEIGMSRLGKFLLNVVWDLSKIVTSVALGDTVAEARDKALAGARQVRFPGAFFRTDIAAEAI